MDQTIDRTREREVYVIAYDIGTTGVKTCLFEIGEKVSLLGSAYGGYGLYILEHGGAEQKVTEWWNALCETTKTLLVNTGISPEKIDGLSFCSQMQGLVLVDKKGNAVRNPMSYMDQRAGKEMRACQDHGLTVDGVNVWMLLRSLIKTNAASTSVKDPIWKYLWVQEHEPEAYAHIYKWLDVKEYLIAKCTGEFVMTEDSAYATFLYRSTGKNKGWDESLCKMYGIRREHLPRIIKCSQLAGMLTHEAAKELGLLEGTAVFGGGGDATIIGVGAGCVHIGDTHIYSGTSGWVSTIINRQIVDLNTMIAGIVGAQQGRYHYFAEMETAGKCFEWVKEHLALDEIGIYLEKKDISQDTESKYESLYDYLTETVKRAVPGAGGVIFTPWLHGNRCPFEAPEAAGMFFNIRLETGKTELLRAVLEGICFHLRWMLECQDRKIRTSQKIRFVGGGALSAVTCQMLADITGRVIETVEDAQDVGAVGAALLAGVGLGVIGTLEQAGELIPIKASYQPNPQNRAVYDRNYKVYKRLYLSNRKNFRILNEDR